MTQDIRRNDDRSAHGTVVTRDMTPGTTSGRRNRTMEITLKSSTLRWLVMGSIITIITITSMLVSELMAIVEDGLITIGAMRETTNTIASHGIVGIIVWAVLSPCIATIGIATRRNRATSSPTRREPRRIEGHQPRGLRPARDQRTSPYASRRARSTRRTGAHTRRQTRDDAAVRLVRI
jgi:hypothetical protein